MLVGRYAFYSPTDETASMTSDDQQFLDLVRKIDSAAYVD
jgi:hypothetical protein